MRNDQNEKVAAGGVVIDKAAGVVRVLLIHRPRYDDWSFPKGGVKPGEGIMDAALREVEEEAGVRCRIVANLSPARYEYTTAAGKRRPKIVHYFLMEVVSGEPSVTGEEADSAMWVEAAAARPRLTYNHDHELLAEVLRVTSET